MCNTSEVALCITISPALRFKCIAYYVSLQTCFCIYKHLAVFISFFLLKYLSSFLLYTIWRDICGNKAYLSFAICTKKRNFGS